MNTAASIVFDSGNYNTTLILILEAVIVIAWLTGTFFAPGKPQKPKTGM